MTDADANRTLYVEVMDRLNAHDLTYWDDLFQPGYVQHESDGSAMNRDQARAAFGEFLAAFPDLHVDIEEVFAAGDRVAAQLTFRGTHQGVFSGIEPTATAIAVQEISIVRIQDGLWAEHWGVLDEIGLMRQLGG